MDRRWWPLYHKTLEAGKKLALLGFSGMDHLKAFKREFGPKFKQCLIGISAESLHQAEDMLNIAGD